MLYDALTTFQLEIIQKKIIEFFYNFSTRNHLEPGSTCTVVSLWHIDFLLAWCLVWYSLLLWFILVTWYTCCLLWFSKSYMLYFLSLCNCLFVVQRIGMLFNTIWIISLFHFSSNKPHTNAQKSQRNAVNVTLQLFMHAVWRSI